MASSIWICKTNGSFKVWGFDLYKNREDELGRIIYYWGSAGRSMNHLTKKDVDGNYWDLYDNVMKQIEDKRCKGYVPIPNHEYFEAVLDFYILIEKIIEKAETR